MNDKPSQKPDLPATQPGMETIKHVRLGQKPPKSARRMVNRLEWHEFSAHLTQHLFHPSIRINRSLSLPDLEGAVSKAVEKWLDYQALEQERERAGQKIPQQETSQPDQLNQPVRPTLEDTEFYKNQIGLLCEVGTGLWRLQQRMVKPGTDQPMEEFRRPFRFFASVWDALHESGVTIQDHTGDDFDPHQALKVLTYEPTPDVTREKVLETIKPTIYYHQVCIQMGEVIVATPNEEPGTVKPAASQ
jgi:hypothetical protein